MTTSNILKDRLSPILKWAGGKEQELKYIHPAMPKKKFNNYYEPFVGGGAVYFSINSNKMFINDKSYELIDLYNTLKLGIYGIQLSEETAVGKYPKECVGVIKELIRKIDDEN